MKQLEETVKLSKIQANYRFRPWVGPFSGIQQIGNSNNRVQFSITVKNYGEIPTSNVLVKYAMKTEMMDKEFLKSVRIDDFNLGPLLPNMEKRYWFFIDSDLIQKVKNSESSVFIILYFVYEHHGGKSGYGLISHYDKGSNSFVHDEMWID